MTTPKAPSSAKHPPVQDEEEDLSIVYPSWDGEPLSENDWQWTAITDTVSTLRIRYGERTDVYVAGDMLVYYRMNDVSARAAPDVYVVFGANGNHRRDSWLVWREGKAPDFVLEVASPGTWEWDATGKREIYAAMGITEYWRFDPKGEFFVPELVGERLTGGEYLPLPLQRDETAMMWGHSAVLGLDICIRPGLELRLYDPAAGQWLLTPTESEAARQEAEAARHAAEAALQDAEEENRRLREQIRSLQTGQ